MCSLSRYVYMLLLLLCCFSHAGLCATPQMAAHHIYTVCIHIMTCVCVCRHIRVSQVVQLVKSMSANAGDQEMRVQSLGQEDPPE